MRTARTVAFVFLCIGPTACGDVRGGSDTTGSDADATTPDTDATQAWTTLYAGAWGEGTAALATELPPAADDLGRPGALLAPAALAVGPSGLLVLDPVGGRVVAFGVDGSSVALVRADPSLVGAIDVAETSDGGLWVLGPATPGAARLLAADGSTHDVALAPELVGVPLMLGPDDDVYLAEPDGFEVHALRISGQDASIEDQVDEGDRRGSPVAFRSYAIIPPAPAAAIDVYDAFHEATRFELPGRPSVVELLTFVGACDGSLVLVVRVKVADGLVDTALRIALSDRALLRQVSSPAPEPFHTPLHPFAVDASGRLYQLRIEGDGYALVAWDLGCP